MWVLMYVFSYSVSPAATNDKAEWRLGPTVVFQEFSNEERCKAAKSTLEASLSQAGARLKSGLEDLKSLGKAVQKAAAGSDAEASRAAAIAYSSALDKAVKSKVIHRNSASNHKSQYAKLIFAAKK